MLFYLVRNVTSCYGYHGHTQRFNLGLESECNVGRPVMASSMLRVFVVVPQCRREKVTPAGGVSAVLCSASGLLYVSVLLLSAPAVPRLLLEAAPWLLSALCGATLDLLVSSLVWAQICGFSVAFLDSLGW